MPPNYHFQRPALGSDYLGHNPNLTPRSANTSIMDQNNLTTADVPTGSTSQAPTDDKRLACPFFKYDPVQYPDCADFIFRHNTDVRVHCIKRCHSTKTELLFCPVCKVTFYGAGRHNKRHNHIRKQDCKLNDRAPWHISPDLVLIGSSDFGNTSEEKAWYFMWDQIFPGHPRPASIYHEKPVAAETRRLNPVEKVSGAIDVFLASARPDMVIRELFGEYTLIPKEELAEFAKQILLDFKDHFICSHGERES